jgi:hypothetical protein
MYWKWCDVCFFAAIRGGGDVGSFIIPLERIKLLKGRWKQIFE